MHHTELARARVTTAALNPSGHATPELTALPPGAATRTALGSCWLIFVCFALLSFLFLCPHSETQVLKNQVQAHTPIFDVAALKKRGISAAQWAEMGGAAARTAAASGAASSAASSSAAASSASAAAATATVSPLPCALASPSLLDRVRYLVYTHGVHGLYRGIGPGTARSMLSNGVSMVVMLQAQKKISEWGWRN